MSTLKEMIRKLLSDLKSVGDIESSAIIARDGLLMAADIPEDIDAETFAAMTATMTGAAETAISELRKGTVSRVIVESEEAKIITTGAGEKALLAVMTRPGAGLGLILVQMKKIAEKFSQIL